MIIAPNTIKTPHIALYHHTDSDRSKTTNITLHRPTDDEVFTIEEKILKAGYWDSLIYKTTNGNEVSYTFNELIPLLPLYMTIAKIACSNDPANHEKDYMCVWDNETEQIEV